MPIRQISPHAARLRREATDCEQRLWAVLRNRQLDGHKFRRQATIGPYIVDLLCASSALIVEIDGGQHDRERDAARTAFLEAEGFNLIRFWNHEVLEDFDGVIEAIRLRLAAVNEERKTPSPNPLPPAGEG
jgi:very-short-patch-repair endonuclease